MSEKKKAQYKRKESLEMTTCSVSFNDEQLVFLEIKAGHTCPKCKQNLLDYNGLLQIVCPKCGVIDPGNFT